GEEPDRTGLKFGFAYDEASRDLVFYGGGNNTALKENHLFPSDAYANIENYLVRSPVSDLGSVFDRSVGYSGIALPDVGRITEADLLGRPLRMNAGVRWVRTKQTLTSLAGDGTAKTEAEYNKFLPSFNATYDVTDSIKLRTSASRTMTRANPGEMYPNSVWTSS